MGKKKKEKKSLATRSLSRFKEEKSATHMACVTAVIIKVLLLNQKSHRYEN